MSAPAPISKSSQQGSPLIQWSYLLPICLIATLGGLLFGFDTGVISGAIEPMTAKFGLSSAMKGWASGCVLIGCAAGVLMVGPLSDRFGRKLAMFLAALLFLISAVGTSLPPNIEIFIIFRIIGGIGIGIASMSTPMYIAEITPGNIRGRLVAVNQIAIVSGLALVYFINYFISHCGDQTWNNEYGWRWMFATGILPSVVFFLMILRIPESPRWLIEQKRDDEAFDILSKITGPDFAKLESDGIRESLAKENGTWKELFSRALIVPLGFGVTLAILQQITGINVFMYFGTTIFKNMSESTGVDSGMLQQAIIGGSGVLFTVIAIASVDKWGRKPLMILGAAGMFISLMAMGLMAQLGHDPVATANWMLGFIILYIACFGLSVGPVVWVILSEIFPTAVRGRALGLATFCLWVADYAVTQTFPMMDANPWLVEKLHHAFPFYVYAFFCLVLLGVMVFVPETKGKSLEEIETMWRRRRER
jgi:SP family xylose:H+ symportor-like MFS transporter